MKTANMLEMTRMRGEKLKLKLAKKSRGAERNCGLLWFYYHARSLRDAQYTVCTG